MRIVFAGTPEFAVPSLHALASVGEGVGEAVGEATADHAQLEIVGVLTREDAPLGRKRVLTPSPVAQAATELGLPVHKANRLDEPATDWVRDLGADLGVIVAYGGLVREPLLSLPRLGWVNLHFSELPAWRGAAPVQRALMNEEQRLGVTVFRLVAALDAGDVLTRDHRDFEVGTSAGHALTELASFGTEALRRAIQLLAANPFAGEPQIGEASYAHKLDREDGKLDLSMPAASVLAQWAGVTPEPGAFVLHDGNPLKLLEIRECEGAVSEVIAATSPTDENRQPGEVRLVSGRAVLDLTDASLELLRVQPAAKPAMAAADWLRGRDGEAVLS